MIVREATKEYLEEVKTEILKKALIGLRLYTGNQPGKTENTVFQEKAKDTIVQANTATIQSLLLAALIGGDINRDEAVELAQNAGLQNPYNEEAMNTSDFIL